MRVKITVLSQGAYCSMSSEHGPHFALDVLLSPGKSAHDALLERACQFERDATRLATYAARCREAAQLIK